MVIYIYFMITCNIVSEDYFTNTSKVYDMSDYHISDFQVNIIVGLWFDYY
jgi:hypothetical protein